MYRIWYLFRLLATLRKLLYSKYRYTKIDTSNNEIRLVKVHPRLTARDGEPIRCTIVTVSLDEIDATYKDWEGVTGKFLTPGKKKIEWKSFVEGQAKKKNYARFGWGDYVAISYTWGSCVEAQSIILDGQLHAVPRSVDVALKSWRAKKDYNEGYVWIDYLCIDQRNDWDKSQQIVRMQKIYECSMLVIVHLGEASEDSNLAIDLVNKISYNSYRGYDYKRHLFLSMKEKLNNKPYIDEKGFSAVRKLFTRPYWRRLWVIQELAMADFVTFVICGNEWTTLHGLRLTMKLFGENTNVLEIIAPTEEAGVKYDSISEALPLLWWIGHLRIQRLAWKDSDSFSYHELRSRALYLAQCAVATHKYDKVFGILGLLPNKISQAMESSIAQLPSISGQISSLQEEADFVKDVFIKFSVSIIDATEDLDMIFARNTFQKVDSCLGLPSWVTDWGLKIDRSGTVPSNDWHFVSDDDTWVEYNDPNANNPLTTSRPWITLDGRRADGGTKGTISFLDDYRVLSCQAISIGCVDSIAPECVYETEPSKQKWPGRTAQSTINISPYIDDEHRIDGLLRTLLFDPLDECTKRSLILTVPWFGEEADEDAASGNIHFGEQSRDFIRQLIEHGWDGSMLMGGFLAFETVRRKLALFPVGTKPFKDYFPDKVTPCLATPTDTDFTQIAANLTNRRLITTTTGHFGLAPSIVHPTDQIFVILGCSVPVILRQCEEGKEYEVVGECWVDGFMRGEAAQQLGSVEYKLQDVFIC